MGGAAARVVFPAMLAVAAACGGNVVVDGPVLPGSGAASTGGSATTSPTTTNPNFPCQDTTSDPHNCGTCGHDCLGGDCLSSLCQPVILASNGYPNGIAVDATHVYWTDLITGVMRLPLAGGTPELLAPADSPEAIALDPAHVYWTAKNSVGRIDLGGGTATSLLSTTLKTGAWALAIDGSTLYWADQILGTIQVIPVGGGPSTTVAKGLSAPDGVVVDATDVYWAEGTDQQTEGSISRMPKAGGSPVTLAAHQQGPRALALDDTSVYWTDSAVYVPSPTGLVMKAPKSGGAATPLASGQGNPLGIAVDATDVYWVNSDSGTVMRVPKGGGTAVTLASAQFYPTAVAVDGSAVYWTTQQKGGAVVKLAK